MSHPIHHQVNIIEHEYRPRGQMRQLWLEAVRGELPALSEILLDGPAGTGKSRCTGEFLHWVCETWPGARCLAVGGDCLV